MTTDNRRTLLVAALGFARVEVDSEPAGIGVITVGMARQGGGPLNSASLASPSERGPAPRCPARRQLGDDLHALELPRREAAYVEMEQVATWPISAPGKLKLELRLGTRDGQLAHRTLSAAAGAAVRPVRTPAGELPVLDCCAGLLSEERVVGHVAAPWWTPSERAKCRRVRRPAARRVSRPAFGDARSPGPDVLGAGPLCVWVWSVLYLLALAVGGGHHARTSSPYHGPHHGPPALHGLPARPNGLHHDPR